MATEVRLPDDAPVWRPDYGARPEAYIQAEREYLESLTRWVKARWRSPLSGEYVRWPMADGHALYIIVSERPFQIAHVAVGDAWRAHAETIRGFRVTDARRMVEADRSLAELFRKPQEFYDTLKPGDVVHYSNGFAQFVRCEVVREKWSDLDGDHDGNRLKPIALVGEIGRRQTEDGRWVHGWPEYDLPRYGLAGEVREGYHVKQVRTGERMRPSASNLWEYPEFHKRDELLALGIDPTKMEPIDLTPPPMSAEQLALMPWAKAINEIRELTNSDGSDKWYTVENLDRVTQEILEVIIKVRAARD